MIYYWVRTLCRKFPGTLIISNMHFKSPFYRICFYDIFNMPVIYTSNFQTVFIMFSYQQDNFEHIHSQYMYTFWFTNYMHVLTTTVYGVLKARILKWLAIPFSSGPHSVRLLHHDPPVLGGPIRHGLVSLS